MRQKDHNGDEAFVFIKGKLRLDVAEKPVALMQCGAAEFCVVS